MCIRSGTIVAENALAIRLQTPGESDKKKLKIINRLLSKQANFGCEERERPKERPDKINDHAALHVGTRWVCFGVLSG